MEEVRYAIFLRPRRFGKSLLCSMLEAYYDIALAPQLDRWPDIAHAALIELKYLKAGDPAPAPDALAAIRAGAVRQLERYSADPSLAAEWQLKPMHNELEPEFQAALGGDLKAGSADLKPEGQFNSSGALGGGRVHEMGRAMRLVFEVAP